MNKLLCERQRIGSSNKSTKTGLKLDSRLDYDDDYDSGPIRHPASRRRQHGYEAKELNENLNPLQRFLYSSVGRPWDDVYSEIRENLRPTKAIDLHILQHLASMVELHVVMVNGIPHHERWGRFTQLDDLYVHPETGILTMYQKEISRPRKDPPIKFLWHDNIWFEKKTFTGPAKCGCVHFFENENNPQMRQGFYPAKVPTRHLVFHPTQNTPCIHGNPPIMREVWYVVEYGYHAPDEVYKTIAWSGYADGEALRYNLNEDNPTHKVYYRDVPEIMAKPFEIRRKTTNKKELQIIRTMLQ